VIIHFVIISNYKLLANHFEELTEYYQYKIQAYYL